MKLEKNKSVLIIDAASSIYKYTLHIASSANSGSFRQDVQIMHHAAQRAGMNIFL